METNRNTYITFTNGFKQDIPGLDRSYEVGQEINTPYGKRTITKIEYVETQYSEYEDWDNHCE